MITRIAALPVSDAFVYGLLLILVWGATAPLRGLWQDDTLLLMIAFSRQGHGLSSLLGPLSGSLRRLYTVPFHLALLTPHPVLALQLLHGAVWLGQALLAGGIARLLLPERRVTKLLVVALTLTATSDYLTNNLTALGYNIAVLTLLLATYCGIHFVRAGGVAWCLGSTAALAWSLWTIDVGIPAVPAALLLFGWTAWKDRAARFRTVALVLCWSAVVAPVALGEWRLLHDPSSYSARAFLPMSRAALARRAVQHWLENFAPWRWAFSRPVWYSQPTALIPAWVMALGAALAALVFGARLRQMPAETRSRPWPEIALAMFFAAMALVSNSIYAGLLMAEIHYRTHVLSRVWASLAIGILAGWAAARGPRTRAVALAASILFVGLGTWGGLERQDFFLVTWRQHQRELLSIVTAAPELKPGTGVILRSAPTPGRYLATAADYLAKSWLVLLYREPGIHSLRLAPDRGTGCQPTPTGLECWHEGQADCVADHTCKPDHFDYDRLVLMDFDPTLGVYRLTGTLDGDPLAAGADAAASTYRPEERILRRDLTADQRRLLLE